MEPLLEVPVDDPCVAAGLLRIRFAMKGVLGEGYWGSPLAREEPDEITTDLNLIYYNYEHALYATKIGRDEAVMEATVNGATVHFRFVSPTGTLLAETRSSLGHPELN